MSKEAIQHLSKADKILGHYIKKIGPLEIELKSALSPFAALLESIVYQQLTGKAAGTILGRVLKLFPGKTFPKPEAILSMEPGKLRAAAAWYLWRIVDLED